MIVSRAEYERAMVNARTTVEIMIVAARFTPDDLSTTDKKPISVRRWGIGHWYAVNEGWLK